MTAPAPLIQQSIRRCSPIYFFYFSFYGLFFPYLGRYLAGMGLDGSQIGLIMAVITSANLYAPFVVGKLSDASGKRLPYIRLGYALMLLTYAMTLISDHFVWLVLSFGLFGVFLSAVLPLMEGVVIAQLGKFAEYYGRVRLWGSLGFVAAVWGIGSLLDVMAVDKLPLIGLVLCGTMLLATWPLSDSASSSSHAESQTAPEAAQPLPWGRISALMLCAMLWQVSMAPYNTFFDLHLQSFDYSGQAIGFFISLGTMAEIVIFLFMVPIIKRLGSYWPMLVALGFTALRWLLIGFYADNAWVLASAQLMHAFTFGTVHSVIIYQVAKLFPLHRQGLGQGMYVALANGLGMVLGNLLGGYNWEVSAERAFVISSLIAVCSMVIYALFLSGKTKLKSAY